MTHYVLSNAPIRDPISQARQNLGFVARDSQPMSLQADLTYVGERMGRESTDQVSIEEPLEILISGQGFEEQTLAITMRTPGHDDELALGFLFTEGIITRLDEVAGIEHCRPPSPDKGLHNAIRITLAETASFQPEHLVRHFYTSSSCGVCGKTSMDAVLRKVTQKPGETLQIRVNQLQSLPASLSHQQTEFNVTGGIHAAALFDESGAVLSLREDVGRHNALDKLIGQQLLSGRTPLTGHGLLLSGRASFELVQKAVLAGAELIAAIGPPSSLALELAENSNLTLIGFLKPDRLNLYTHPNRVLV